jgi:RimJ/RimL family protein N-acetyltransferase
MEATANISPLRSWVSQRLEAVPCWFLCKDGTWLYVRLIQPEDEERLLHFFKHLSSHTRRRRFHTIVDYLEPEVIQAHAHEFASVDNKQTGGALVAVDFRSTKQNIVGVVRLSPPQEGVAEVAVVVRDDFQGRGVARALLQRLPTLARRMGVHTIVARVEADNLPALRLFRRWHFPMTSHTSRGETEIHIHLPNG